ncbi:hypothetical protein OAQ84_01350, partial [Bdellovibrionales bacterium]|nr:hypothetical protein [Bdellovibrionales bacterium]
FRFDSSISGTIELEETDGALTVFAPTLGDLLGIDPVDKLWDIKVLFTYMLKYGSSPTRDDPIASIEYLYWRWHPEVWSYRSDRLKLAQILASLTKLL